MSEINKIECDSCGSAHPIGRPPIGGWSEIVIVDDPDDVDDDGQPLSLRVLAHVCPTCRCAAAPSTAALARLGSIIQAGIVPLKGTGT